jgi:hypothetical protein
MIMGLSAFDHCHRPDRWGPWWPACWPTLTGNYRMGFTLLALVAGTGSLLFLLAKKPE